MNKFNDYMAEKAPKLIIIERQITLHKALMEVYPGTPIIFDPWHLQKSLSKQFSENEDEFVQSITHLPLERNLKVVEDTIEKMKIYDFKDNIVKNLVDKLIKEKELWSMAYHRTYFTGGVCICQRNELLKNHLKSSLVHRNYTVSDGFSRLISMNEKEFKYDEEYSSIEGKYNSVFQKVPLISTFAKKYLTQYAYQKLKYEVAKATKYEIIKKKESDSYKELNKLNSWRIRSTGSASEEAQIYECVRIPTPFPEDEDDKSTYNCDTIVVCSSLTRQNTGLPDASILTLFLRNVINFEELVFNKRWYKDYESKYKSKLNENLLSQLCEAEKGLSDYCIKYAIADVK